MISFKWPCETASCPPWEGWKMLPGEHCTMDFLQKFKFDGFFLAKDHFLFIKLLQIVCMCHVICAFTCTQFYTDYSLDEVKFSCHFKFSWKLFVKWVPGFHISVHHHDEWIPSVSFLHFFPDSKAHWAHVGPTWSRQDPCWANLGPTKFAVGAYCSQAWGSVINWTNIDLF